MAIILADASNDERLQHWAELLVGSAWLIVLLGVCGVLMIVGLLWAWRRHQGRERDIDAQAAARKAAGSSYPDAWTVSAQRVGGAETPAGDPDAPPHDPPRDADELADEGPESSWATGEDIDFFHRGDELEEDEELDEDDDEDEGEDEWGLGTDDWKKE